MNSTVITRIQKHIQSYPNQKIVLDNGRVWTWADLSSRAEDYRSVLLNHKLSQKIIPLVVDRSGESIAAILGCLFAGFGFAPLSGQQPKERLAKCLEALDSKILLVANPTNFSMPFDGVEILVPIHQNKALSISQQDFTPETTIYNLFTSGSTGVPKGVLVSSANIENTMLWSQEILDWKENDIIGCATNFFFDISMFDFFTMAYFNIPLAIYSETTNPETVLKETERFGITSIFSVPLFFSQLSRHGLHHSELKNLRRILSGGDFFPPAHILNWMKGAPHVQIYNVWGPTETSIVNTMYKVTAKDIPLLEEGKSLPVGQAMAKMPFVLVDEKRENVVTKPFERGEVTMLGACVTQGYLKAPELTKTFYSTVQGQAAFFTQDLGYVNEQGELFILGRMGSTVKISGYRVDLGEIEAATTKFDNIYIASAFVKKISDEVEELWLVVELTNKQNSLDVFSFKNFLRNNLPHYMVPKRIFVQDKLPKNANGKIDRNQVKQGNYA